jgi:hypothetical protein
MSNFVNIPRDLLVLGKLMISCTKTIPSRIHLPAVYPPLSWDVILDIIIFSQFSTISEIILLMKLHREVD